MEIYLVPNKKYNYSCLVRGVHKEVAKLQDAGLVGSAQAVYSDEGMKEYYSGKKFCIEITKGISRGENHTDISELEISLKGENVLVKKVADSILEKNKGLQQQKF